MKNPIGGSCSNELDESRLGVSVNRTFLWSGAFWARRGPGGGWPDVVGFTSCGQLGAFRDFAPWPGACAPSTTFTWAAKAPAPVFIGVCGAATRLGVME